VVPNFTTQKLIDVSMTGANMPITRQFNPLLVPDPAPIGGVAQPCMPAPGSLCASSRHSFLLNFVDPGTTAAAQTQAATFMATGVVP
jgi:hypothetical protein